MDDKMAPGFDAPDLVEATVEVDVVEVTSDGPDANTWSEGTGEDGEPVIQNGRGPEHEIPMPDMQTARRTARQLNRAERKGEKRAERAQEEQQEGYWDENAGPNSDALS